MAPTAPASSDFETACIESQGGLRWVWAPAARASELRAWAAQHGGHATLFRASPQGGEADKAVGVFHPLGPTQAALQERLRRAFDPHNVFHTGRLLPRSFHSHLASVAKA